MAYKHYNRAFLARVVFLAALLIATGWLLHTPIHWVLAVVLCLVDVAAIIELVRFVNVTNRKINYFLDAVKNDDTSIHFPEKSGNAIIDELHVNLNNLNLLLQQAKVENRIKERYFSEILEKIATGIIVLDEKGFVRDVNTSVLNLLKINHFTHISQLARIDYEFKTAIEHLGGSQKQVLSLHINNEVLQIVVQCSEIDLKHEHIRLITMQDIRGELERKEIDSWVKLIRVLNHEIMNSLTPVTSIAQMLKGVWQEKLKYDQNISKDKDVESTIEGLDVIGERGESLIRFVKSYRALTKAPEPKLAEIDMFDFLDSLRILLSPLKENFKGNLLIDTPQEDFTFFADEQMIVQVVINLVKNAVEKEYETGQPQITVTCGQSLSNYFITVKDNGPGIPPEIIDDIFVPFFTTKENGSGIGLSLSRHILRLHGGTLKVHSEPGEDTQFVLVLPKQ